MLLIILHGFKIIAIESFQLTFRNHEQFLFALCKVIATTPLSRIVHNNENLCVLMISNCEGRNEDGFVRHFRHTLCHIAED